MLSNMSKKSKHLMSATPVNPDKEFQVGIASGEVSGDVILEDVNGRTE